MSNKITVFDTTLRDGEQAAGSRLGAREKLTIARQLERLQVDVIEAGFPASSPEDAAAVALIAQEVKEPTICGLTRAVKADIDVCAKALEKASRPRIHTGIGVSDIHVMGKFGDIKYGQTIEEKKKRILDMATNAVRHASTFDVGMSQTQVVLTARTGRHGVRHRLEELGHIVSPEEMEQIYQRFLVVADKKREVFDDDLVAILHDEIRDEPEIYQLEEFQITTGTKAMPTASVQLREGDQVTEGAACGDGPVDALYRAIASVANISPQLEDYDIRSVTSGTEAMGEVTVKLKTDDRQVVGRGAATDIIAASARAYLDGLNKLARYLKK